MADQVIQSIVEWVSAAPPLGIYFIFFGVAYFENIVPPVPGDVLVAFGGYLAAEGVVGVTPIWGTTVTASVIGFMTMYWVGHKWGAQIENDRHNHIILQLIDYKYFYRGKKWMARWGQGVILANRFLAGTRSVISLTAGMSNLKVSTTIISSLISSMLWNCLLIGAGWFVRDNWKVVGTYLSNYGKIILALIVLFVAYKAYFMYKRKVSAEKDRKE